MKSRKLIDFTIQGAVLGAGISATLGISMYGWTWSALGLFAIITAIFAIAFALIGLAGGK